MEWPVVEAIAKELDVPVLDVVEACALDAGVHIDPERTVYERWILHLLGEASLADQERAARLVEALLDAPVRRDTHPVLGNLDEEP